MTDPGIRWEEQAECRNHEPEKWYPPSNANRRRAAADAIFVCRALCPVRQKCAAFARRTGQRVGVWGGVDLGDSGGPIDKAAADALRQAAEGVA